jgi:hypothetical protein
MKTIKNQLESVETVKIKNWKFKLCFSNTYSNYDDETAEHNIDTYRKEFKTKTDIHNFYVDARSKAILTNFGGDEYNNNSYIVIENIVKSINPFTNKVELVKQILTVENPRAKNGDDNWYSYPEDFGFVVNLTRVY